MKTLNNELSAEENEFKSLHSETVNLEAVIEKTNSAIKMTKIMMKK